MAKRFTRIDLVEDGPLSEGNYYYYINRAKKGGYLTDVKDSWGEETRSKPRKSYLVSEFREFLVDDDRGFNIKEPNRVAILDRLDELENGKE